MLIHKLFKTIFVYKYILETYLTLYYIYIYIYIYQLLLLINNN